MRLNAYLARAGVASRRGADALIKARKVTVNGVPGQLNDDINQGDKVEVNGQVIGAQKLKYILLNKPAGYVTTVVDPQNRPKVTDLVNINERVVPVGRLDMDTTGALLMTNDGELAYKLMHPSFEIDKIYEIQVKGPITSEKLNKLSNGLIIDGHRTAPARARKIAGDKVELVVHEGRKHQVKKMLAQVDLPVVRLHRSQYGPLKPAGLKPGQWRELSAAELKLIKYA